MKQYVIMTIILDRPCCGEKSYERLTFKVSPETYKLVALSSGPTLFLDFDNMPQVVDLNYSIAVKCGPILSDKQSVTSR